LIKIKFLNNNTFLVKFNRDNVNANFNYYINIITSKLIYCVKPNLGEEKGWIFHHSKLKEVISYFKDPVYENEYIPPDYMDMGSDMKLQPYEYQKEAIYFGIQEKEGLLVLPCGSGKLINFIV
jgi:hypothetical protein